MSQYDPCQPLELYHNVGTASVSSMTDEFVVLEDYGPFSAEQFQSMYDGGWRLMFPPQVEGTSPQLYYYTFQQGNLDSFS